MKVSLLLLVILAQYAQSYTVQRNVKDYGAKGNGVTDDTAAIILALTEGRGDNPNAPYGSTTYSSSTKTPAYVFFPGGTYIVTETLPVVYYTQMVGDPNNVPVIKFQGSNVRVLEVAGGWYTGVNQDNFYRQIRNFVIDMTDCHGCTGVHWQVAQATSITNVYFKAGIGSSSQGMWMENGSGGFISDIIFEGGTYGMWVGNQQFTSRNITVRSVSVAAIYLNWDWVWTFTGLQVSNSPIAIDVAVGTGSVVVVDSIFTNVPVGIKTTFSAGSGVNTVLVDNLQVQGSSAVVQNNGNNALTSGGGSTTFKSWGQGHIWKNKANTIGAIDLSSVTPARPASLVTGSGNYFTKIRPDTYYNSQQIDVTTIGIPGDNQTDVTAPLQQALNKYANNAILFFPHGTYVISNTVVVPPGSRLLGQAWSVIMADGNAFQNQNNPTPVLQVGKVGDKGVAQITDFMFSTRGPQPGAKLIEWNMHDPAGAPGSCGIWDSHFRIGGAIGTSINPWDCPSGNGGGAPNSKCAGAYSLMHITTGGNVYMENVWGWTADHDIDYGSQLNVYNGRGILVESQGPVWMYGTAMEHHLYYQYNFNFASNIFMGAIQTETPYFQPSTATPFAPISKVDPSFCTNDARCNMAYGLVITNSSNIYIYSTGLYSFFEVWSQACLTGQPSCQLALIDIENSEKIHAYAVSTYGSVNMLTGNEDYTSAANNKNTFCATVLVDLDLF